MFLTTTSKVNAVKKLIREKKYDEAVEIAEKIDPDKVASVYDLSSIAEAYMKKGRLEEAKHLYLVMYERNKSHKVMTGLIELSLKLKEPKDAERFLREFRRMEPDNPERLVYRYRVDSMLGKDPEYLVKSLAKLKNEEYTDVWALELAKAYYKCNDREACAAECHSIIKYFPDSEVARKANVLLGACEIEDEEPVETAPEEDVDTTEIAESLLQDVSAMLEENAAAEAVANEVLDEKVIASQTPAHPVPYLRTLEFLVQCKPAAEDLSQYGDLEEEEPAVSKETAKMMALSEAFVLPEALKGQIDNVIFETDDDDDDIVITCGEVLAETAEDAAEADDDDDDEEETVISGYFDEEPEEAEEEATDEAEDSEEAEDDEESEEDDEDVEEAEEDEESDEDDDTEDAEEADEVDEEESEEAEDSEEEEDADADDDTEDDDVEDEDESGDEADEEKAEDGEDEADDEDVEDEEDAEVAEDEPEEGELNEEYFEDEVSDEDEDVSVDNGDLMDETLSSMADKLASQILSATAEEQMLRDEAPVDAAEEPAERPEDTKVMEGLSDRAFREAVKDDDEAIERALYSLLGDDSRK